MEGSYALYCENTCYRAVDFVVWNIPDYDELFPQVTDLKENVFLVPGYFETICVNDDENLGEDNGENYMYKVSQTHMKIWNNHIYYCDYYLLLYNTL